MSRRNMKPKCYLIDGGTWEVVRAYTKKDAYRYARQSGYSTDTQISVATPEKVDEYLACKFDTGNTDFIELVERW